MGLDPQRDRLCVVQLSPGDGSADVVQIPPHAKDAPNIKRLLADPGLLKIFHFARFDLGILYKSFGVMPAPVYCTKIASRLARTYTDKHGLKDLVREVLGQEMSKQQQSSDWGAEHSATRKSPTRPRTCCICMRSRPGSTPCWPARARNWPPPASASSPTGSGSISAAGRPRTFSPIVDVINKG